MTGLKNLHSTLFVGYGSKADTLSKAHQLGIMTPKGFVFKASHYSGPEVKKSVSELKFPLIVRSSTHLEDGSRVSLAGVFKSVKVTRLEDLVPAIKSVKDWSDSKEVADMLKVFSLKDQKIRTNIIVQEYISGVASGVMFVYPKQKKIIFESSEISDAVTDGTATSIERTVYFDDPDTDALANSLVGIAKQIADSFIKPTDIEWVVTEDMTPYVLQIRDVTSDIDHQEYVQEEITRLEKTFEAHELYDDNILPDIEDPTPLTISILSRIYSTDGAFGKYFHAQFGAHSERHESFIAVLFARPCLDYKAVNKYLSNVSAKTYTRDKDGITFRTTLRSSLSIAAHPINTICRVFRHVSSIFRLRKYIQSTELAGPKKDFLLPELVDYLVNDLSYDAFVTSGYIQFIEKQISKRVRNNFEYDLITQDISLAPWRNTAKLDVESDCWHLSYNENEVSSPPMIASPRGIKDIQRMYALPRSLEKRDFHRDQVSDKFISTWDKTFLRNQLRLLDELQQRRNNTHDKYVQSVRLIHYKIVAMQTSSDENLLWYATIDEMLQNAFPEKEILEKRKTTHQSLQRQFVDTVGTATSWRLRVTSSNQAQNDMYSLSHGDFQGLATENFLVDHPQKTVALVRSLSNEVIFNHEKLAGVITEKGSSLSHVAILAREIGLPVVRVNSINELKEQQVKFSQDGKVPNLEVIK